MMKLLGEVLDSSGSQIFSQSIDAEGFTHTVSDRSHPLLRMLSPGFVDLEPFLPPGRDIQEMHRSFVEVAADIPYVRPQYDHPSVVSSRSSTHVFKRLTTAHVEQAWPGMLDNYRGPIADQVSEIACMPVECLDVATHPVAATVIPVGFSNDAHFDGRQVTSFGNVNDVEMYTIFASPEALDDKGRTTPEDLQEDDRHIVVVTYPGSLAVGNFFAGPHAKHPNMSSLGQSELPYRIGVDLNYGVKARPPINQSVDVTGDGGAYEVIPDHQIPLLLRGRAL